MVTNSLGWVLETSGAGVRSIALLPGFLEALQTIRDADTTTVEWSEALKRLVTGLDAGQKPPKLAEAQWTELIAAWGGLKDTLRLRFPDALRALTYKLSDFFTPGAAAGPNPIGYPLSVTGSEAGAVPIGGLAFETSANASATAALTLQTYNEPPALIVGLGYQGPANEFLIRIGLRGELAAGAGASVTPTWGKVSASASVSAGAYMDHYFHFPASRYLAQTLIEALPQMVGPGDLAALLRVGAQPIEVRDFAMVITELNGTLKLGGEVGVGVSVAGSFGNELAAWEKTNGGKPATIGAELSLSASFRWDVTGSYRTVARVVGSGARLRIDRLTGSTGGVGISAGAVIDVNGLQALLDPVLARLLPTSNPLIDRLGKLADLRGLALDAANDALDLDGSGGWDSVVSKLLALGADADSGPAKAALSGALSDLLDSFAKDKLASKDALLAEAPAKVSALLTNALGDTAVSVSAGQMTKSITDKIGARIDATYAEFREQITDEIAGSIASILAVPSAGLQAIQQQIQGRLEAFTGPLVAWLKKYEALRAKLAKAIAQVESAKLALAFSYSYEKERKDATIIEVAFEKDTPAARALYIAMCAGRLEAYPALRAACESEQSAKQVSWLDESSQTRRVSSGVVINVFGWQSSTATLTALDEVAISVDDTGRILVASDHVQLMNVMTLRKKTTRATVDLGLELFATGKTPPLSTVYSASGEAFSQSDEQGFYALLVAAGAVSPGAADRMRGLLWSGSAANSATLIDAELSLVYQPDAGEWERLLSAHPDDIEMRVRQTGLELLGAAARSGGERGLPDDHSPKAWVAGWLRDAALTESLFWQAAIRPVWSDFYNDSLVVHTDWPTATGTAKTPAQRAVYNLWQIARIARATGDAWKRIAQVNLLLAQLRSPSSGLSRSQAYERLSSLSGDIRTDLTRVFERVIPDWTHPTKVGWQYLTLILALARLASADDDLHLLTTARANIDGVDRTFFVS